MSFENINLITWTIFTFMLIISVYLVYVRFKIIKKNLPQIKNVFPYYKFNYLKLILLFISFLIAAISIFQPKWFPSKKEIKNQWIDIMFVLDVSKSMNTIDVKNKTYPITRLQLAKQAIKQFITNHPNNRYWLVIFAWDAITTIPLTSDVDTFLTLLAGVNYKNLTKQWTNFNSAIQHAIDSLKLDKNKWKVLVLISDWWDPEDYQWLHINLPKDLKTIVIWIWSKQGWRIYLGNDVFWDPIWQTYNGQYVITRLNETNLKKLANDLNWVYIHLQKVSDIKKLNSYLQNIAKQAYKSSIIQKQDLTRYFLIASFIFFLFYILIEIKNEKTIYS